MLNPRGDRTRNLCASRGAVLARAMLALITACMAGMAGTAGPAHAEYMAPRLKQVPIARLLANIDGELAKRPGDPELLFRAARLHALAWAIEGDQLQVDARDEAQPWLGYEPLLVPFDAFARAAARAAVPPASPPAKPRTAAPKAKQLDEAIGLYRRGLELGGTDIERLGLGYCLLQTGRATDRADGIRILRIIGDRAWATEMSRVDWGLGDHGIAWEAAGYLLRVLDAAKDAKERAELEARRAQVESAPRPITPIVVPLEDDLTLDAVTVPDARASFDLDASGRDIAWGWIRPHAAWLAYDADGSGTIDSGMELIGARTFDVFWADGFAVLAALDDDHDGWLRGDELAGLSLWNDANANGRSDTGEVTPCARTFVAVATRATALEADGTLSNPTGLVLANGAQKARSACPEPMGCTRPMWDWLAPSSL